MNIWVGVTDNAWFSFLATRGLDEVNFWQPSATPPFTSAPVGMPFLFKLKRPHNHIAGGEMWFNGKAYYRLNDQDLSVLPDAPANHPDRDRLGWHYKNRFQA